MAVVQRDGDRLAVWCLAMTGPASVDMVNAVVVDASDLSTIEVVLHRQVVVGTDDLPEGLSVDSTRSTDQVVGVLHEASEELQGQISAAIAAHDKRNRTRLVRPDWVRRQPAELGPLPTDLSGRTLVHAKLLRARWQEWLDTEKQRLRRSRSPRTGESPYIMPEDLSMLAVRSLPPALGVGDLVVPTQQVDALAGDE